MGIKLGASFVVRAVFVYFGPLIGGPLATVSCFGTRRVVTRVCSCARVGVLTTSFEGRAANRVTCFRAPRHALT